MGLFDRLFSNVKITPAKYLFENNLKASKDLLEPKDCSNGAVFEALLFASIYTLRFIRNYNPRIYNQFEKDYFMEVLLFANSQGITKQLSINVNDFINGRMEMYGNELNHLLSNENGDYVPIKFAYNLYEKPLKPTSGESWDLEKTFLLAYKIKTVIETINDGTSSLIAKGSI